MSFYNMKNIAVKMLLIKLINQFSKLNRYYIIMYKQQRKNLLNSDRYFFDNNLVGTTNMIYSVFKLFNSNILTCTFSETAAMAILSI